MTWLFGQTWWCGVECLLCTGVIGQSHNAVLVATYDEEDQTSVCPGCGATVRWTTEPAVDDSPLCSSCREASL